MEEEESLALPTLSPRLSWKGHGEEKERGGGGSRKEKKQEEEEAEQIREESRVLFVWSSL